MFTWLASNPWAYPALEVLHIVGIALLLGNLVLLEVRLWGGGATLPLPALARVALPLMLAGFGLCAASGLLMFASQPLELLDNRAFVIKMGLLMVAGSNAAIFHARGGRSGLIWRRGCRPCCRWGFGWPSSRQDIWPAFVAGLKRHE